MSYILVVVMFLFGVLAFYANTKEHQIEKECNEKIAEQKKDEVKKDNAKESLHTGNDTDDINAGLDLLRNNKNKRK